MIRLPPRNFSIFSIRGQVAITIVLAHENPNINGFIIKKLVILIAIININDKIIIIFYSNNILIKFSQSGCKSMLKRPGWDLIWVVRRP